MNIPEIRIFHRFFEPKTIPKHYVETRCKLVSTWLCFCFWLIKSLKNSSVRNTRHSRLPEFPIMDEFKILFFMKPFWNWEFLYKCDRNYWRTFNRHFERAINSWGWWMKLVNHIISCIDHIKSYKTIKTKNLKFVIIYLTFP